MMISVKAPLRGLIRNLSPMTSAPTPITLAPYRLATLPMIGA